MIYQPLIFCAVSNFSLMVSMRQLYTQMIKHFKTKTIYYAFNVYTYGFFAKKQPQT